MVYAMDVCSILKGKVGGHAARAGMIQLSTRRRAPRKTMGALCQLWEALWPHPCNCDMFWYTDMYTYVILIYMRLYCDILCILRYIMICATGSFHFFSHRPGIETCSVTGFSLDKWTQLLCHGSTNGWCFTLICKRGDRCHGWKACKHLHKRILFKLSASAHIRCSNCFYTNKSFAWTFSSGKPQHCK
jgi:hypothetical protein